MSSRTENGDAWRQYDDRTADRGPGSKLPPARRAPRWRGVMPGRVPGWRRPPPERPGRPRPGEENAGWSVFSYLISGMAVYGVIGWLVGRWTHLAFLFPLG